MRLLACLLLVVLLAACCPGAIVVSLRSQASVRGDEITVGDIATVTAPAAQLAPVQAVVVAAAPLPGTTRPVRREQVEWRLAQGGVKGFAVTGPSVVTVSRATRTLSPEELDQAAQDCLRQQAPELAAQMEFTPTCATSRVMVPEGQVEIRAQASGTAVGALRAVRLTILAEGQVVRTLTVRYRLRLEVEAPVAACSLSVGSALTPASWWVQRADAAALPGRPLRPQEMADRRMRRSVNAGAVLTTDNTEPIPLVIRGGKVMVVVHVGAIVLTCEGTAQADGAAGQSIAVQNPASKQVFEAVVIGPGRAEIRL